ncbi:hypothetical protein RvY_13620 [Ramazzottius varieornatus]|uniref:Uncharacterized protein n=1 Tax=Ramazzottius varieornatus TaxID=947166 RepID=A0A1D1VNH8_RAMVA|nr:hypothetical protein RvY_13620 [Ramazzottius varieornatus]
MKGTPPAAYTCSLWVVGAREIYNAPQKFRKTHNRQNVKMTHPKGSCMDFHPNLLACEMQELAWESTKLSAETVFRSGFPFSKPIWQGSYRMTTTARQVAAKLTSMSMET